MIDNFDTMLLLALKEFIEKDGRGFNHPIGYREFSWWTNVLVFVGRGNFRKHKANSLLVESSEDNKFIGKEKRRSRVRSFIQEMYPQEWEEKLRTLGN